MKVISSVVVLLLNCAAFGIPRETPEVRVIPPDGIAKWTNVQVEVCTTEQGKARTALTEAQSKKNYNANSKAGSYFDTHIETICDEYRDVNFAIFEPIPGNLGPNGAGKIESSMKVVIDTLQKGKKYLSGVSSKAGKSVQRDYNKCKALRDKVINEMEKCKPHNDISLEQSCKDDKFITALSQFFSLASRTLTKIIQKWRDAI